MELNKERPIENTMEVNIYYQGYRKNGDRCDRKAKVECNFENTTVSLPQS